MLYFILTKIHNVVYFGSKIAKNWGQKVCSVITFDLYLPYLC